MADLGIDLERPATADVDDEAEREEDIEDLDTQEKERPQEHLKDAAPEVDGAEKEAVEDHGMETEGQKENGSSIKEVTDAKIEDAIVVGEKEKAHGGGHEDGDGKQEQREGKKREERRKDKEPEDRRKYDKGGEERRRADREEGDGRRSDRGVRERDRDRYEERSGKRGDADDDVPPGDPEELDERDRRKDDRSPPRKEYRDRSRSPAYRDRRSFSPRRDDRYDRSDRHDRHDRRRSPPRDRYRSPPRRDHGARGRKWSPPRNRHNGVGRPGNNLFIAGFNFITTEKDLERKFSRYGRVLDVRIVRDARTRESRGFGFVAMDTDAEADDAIDALDQTEWHGRVVLVEKARTGGRT